MPTRTEILEKMERLKGESAQNAKKLEEIASKTSGMDAIIANLKDTLHDTSEKLKEKEKELENARSELNSQREKY